MQAFRFSYRWRHWIWREHKIVPTKTSSAHTKLCIFKSYLPYIFKHVSAWSTPLLVVIHKSGVMVGGGGICMNCCTQFSANLCWGMGCGCLGLRTFFRSFCWTPNWSIQLQSPLLNYSYLGYYLMCILGCVSSNLTNTCIKNNCTVELVKIIKYLLIHSSNSFIFLINIY